MANFLLLANRIVGEIWRSRDLRQKAWDYEHAVKARIDAENKVSMFKDEGINCPESFLTDVEQIIDREHIAHNAFVAMLKTSPVKVSSEILN